MASEHRRDAPDLAILEALAESPEKFDFFQALRSKGSRVPQDV